MGIAKRAKHLGEMAEGKAKEITGKVLGDTRLERKGKADQAKERVKQAVARGKRSLKH
ncbi:CsbD family protein [Streptomyces sp. NPDC048506]|uniref:CsbD family protein n=1 Tax=Streptomyces sp. NPDC048506 TaxID=3155028 RepID=UPI00343F3734